jgi:hypothetical protein
MVDPIDGDGDQAHVEVPNPAASRDSAFHTSEVPVPTNQATF